MSKVLIELQSLGVTLIITVDVGITALSEVADAQSRNIDVIVTDHHSVRRSSESEGGLELLPAAFAIVHPAVGDYPEKIFCGAATAFINWREDFCLMRYGSKKYEVPEGWEKWFIGSLVGFATLTDMVPLTGENRGCGSLVWHDGHAQNLRR